MSELPPRRSEPARPGARPDAGADSATMVRSAGGGQAAMAGPALVELRTTPRSDGEPARRASPAGGIGAPAAATGSPPVAAGRNSATILIVDDDRRNCALLEAQLKVEGYRTLIALDGQSALDMTRTHHPDLVLLDIMMPGMDGFEVTGRLKQDPATRNIPIIMVTALNDRNSRLAALNKGAEEFLTKPVDRSELWIRVRNLLRLKEYQDFLAQHNQILEEQVAQRTEQLQRSYHQTIYTMTRAAEYKDEETGAHVQRISHYCGQLAEALGMDREFRDCIHYSSPMHDVGKIAIPDRVLLKPGPLSAEEWEVMKTHTQVGAHILGQADSPYLRMGTEIALAHHEKWDGTGYPNRLAGEAIPFAARLMAIADVYDALRSRRPYKPAMEHRQAVEIITRGDGRTMPGHFDPQVLAAFDRRADAFADVFAQDMEPPRT